MGSRRLGRASSRWTRPRPDRHRRHHGRHRAGPDRLSRRANPPRPSRPTPISSCISSKGRSWSARPSRSASSPAPRRRSGTTRWRPARTAMPAPRRPRPARTRWSAPPGSSTWWTGSCAPAAKMGAARSGQLQVSPNSRNVVPGEVRFSVEFRHPDRRRGRSCWTPNSRPTRRRIARRLRRAAGVDRAVPHPGPAVRSRPASISCARVRRSWAIRRARSFPAPATTRSMSRAMYRRR